MEGMLTRRAMDTDREMISNFITENYALEFLEFNKNLEAMREFIEEILVIERFFVTELDEQIIAVVACTDGRGRALEFDASQCRRTLGWWTSLRFTKELKKAYLTPLPYPHTTGFIEFLCVKEEMRGQAVAFRLMHEVFRQTPYKEYLVSIADDNVAGNTCAQALGFQELCRVPVHHSHRENYHAQRYLEYRTK